MVLSPPLRVLLGVGIVLMLAGWFVLEAPASLWATLLGALLVLGALIAGFTQQRRR